MIRSLVIGDLTLRAATPAEATARSGRSLSPILFIHGLFATAWIWDPFLDFFAGIGYPAYALNLRGRNGSRPVLDLGRVRMADFVDDARDVARALGTPIVFGHSLGGLVAQQLAADGAASAVVLVSPAPPRGIPVLSWRLAARLGRYLPAIVRSRPLVPRFEDLSALVLNRVPAEQQRELFARFVPDSGRAARDIVLGAVRVDARRVRCPVLVLGAEDDRFLPLAIARRVAQRYGAPFRSAAAHGHASIREPGWDALAAYAARWLGAAPNV